MTSASNAETRCDGAKPKCSRCAVFDSTESCIYSETHSSRAIRNEGESAISSSIPTEIDPVASFLATSFENTPADSSFQNGSNGMETLSSFPYSLSTLNSFLAGSAGAEQQSSTSEAAKINIDADPHSSGYSLPPGFNREQQSNVPLEMSQPSLLTPNTETILQDFLNMPLSPAKAVATDTPNSRSTMNASSQLALLPNAHSSLHITQNGSADPAFGSMHPSFPMYQFPTLLPTGLHLFSPPPPESLNFSEMFSSMDSEAAAYHFSLPVNLTKLEEYSAMPQIEQEQQQSSSFAPAAPPGVACQPSNAQMELDPGWFPAVDLSDAGRRANDPIDVPPFVRDKLFRSFFDNLGRCPCCYVNRDRLEKRLKMGLDERPHPAWIFSMYLIGAIWLQDPSVSSMESHFYSVAKEQLYLGLSNGDRSLDLIRAGANLAVYLIQRDREQESFVVSMQAIMLSRACGLHVARAKRDSQLNRLTFEARPLRQVMCRLDVPRDDTEIMERLHGWATIHGLDTFGILVGGRPPSVEGHLTAPVHYVPASDFNPIERFFTLRDLFEGATVDLQAEKPSAAPTRIVTALLGYVFNLTFLPREEIGDNHRRAKLALDAFVGTFPPDWHHISKYTYESRDGVVPEQHALIGLWCAVHVINAYICEIDPSLTNERPVDHAMKIAQYIPLVEEGIFTMQMQMTIFLEFCAKALAQEGGRLHMIGRHREAFSLERISEVALLAMAKIARVYGFHSNETSSSFFEMHNWDESTGISPPFILNPPSSHQSDSSSTAHM